jgi:uncharacterized hydrophobic protein (TIGR00271 family)
LNQIQFIRKFLDYLSLDKDADDFEKIHESITRNIVFKGTNLWILIFAILIASVGLNMNSTAVIIGAMLISPLMGPINGMGYSLATYDFKLFRKALNNFLFAVIAGLAASTLYFAVSPISTAHSELLSRISPTIYDVLIAFFGGLAGIVAASSRQKGNVIPGVAIATALMPPLCTAGFGLATGQFHYFFGAFYLFTINTVFIALAAMVITQIMGFPIKTIVETTQKKRMTIWISAVTISILVPSIYFGNVLVKKDKFNENANLFVKNIGIVEGNFLLKSQVDPDNKIISLVYGGTKMTETQKNKIKERASYFSLPDATIIFEQGLSFSELNSNNTEVENLKAVLNKLNLMLEEKEAQTDSLYKSKLIGQQLLFEIKNLYPQLMACAYAEAYLFSDSVPNPSNVGIVVFTTKDNKLITADKEKINNWLKTRLKTDRIKVIYEE